MADPGSQAVDGPPVVEPRERRAGRLLAAVVLAPLVAYLVWALVTTIHSGGDVALTEISVRDVGGTHTPLFGVYSRYGWHHPGPLLFYALAVPYRLLGTDGSALAGGAVLVNALAVGGSAWLLWRRGRLGGLVVGGLVLAVLLHSLGGAVLPTPWNPLITVLPLLLFVLAVWSVVCGDAWMLPIVIGAGSFVVQAHVGTAGVVLVGGIAAGLAVVATRRARKGGGRLWIVSLVAWVWVARIVDEPFDYLVRWTELTGALVWLTIGWSVLEEVRAVASVPTRRVVGAVGALAVTVTLALGALTAVQAFDDHPALGEQRAYDRLAGRLQRAGRRLRAPVAVADAADLSSAGLGASVLNGLLGAGVDAGVRPEFGWQVAGAHVVARDRAGTRLLVAYGDEGERLRDDPRYRVLVSTDELPPARRAELDRLQASYTGIGEQIRWSRSHPVLARRLAELAAHS